MQEIFIPTLSHWEHGNPWSGYRGLARYYLYTQDGQINAELWKGELARALSEPLYTRQFPISGEGLEELRQWLTGEIERLNREA